MDNSIISELVDAIDEFNGASDFVPDCGGDFDNTLNDDCKSCSTYWDCIRHKILKENLDDIRAQL